MLRVSTTSIEHPPLPPYPGNHLPPYSLSDSDASVNVANASSESYDGLSDATSATECSIAPEDNNSEVTSANTTIGSDNEFPVPPTPSISTIPLPSLSSNDHILQHDSSSDSENDDSIHQRFSVNQRVNNLSEIYNPNFDFEATGGLGLMFD